MKISRRLIISAILTVTAAGTFYVRSGNADCLVTGVDSPVIPIPSSSTPVLYRDISGEHRVRPVPITIKGSGFSPGGGVVQGKDGPIPVSRYALRFDEAPFPMSDLKVADGGGTKLSGVVRVPIELLTDTTAREPHPFRVYDRIQGRFLPSIPKDAATVRFSLPPSAPSPK